MFRKEIFLFRWFKISRGSSHGNRNIAEPDKSVAGSDNSVAVSDRAG